MNWRNLCRLCTYPVYEGSACWPTRSHPGASVDQAPPGLAWRPFVQLLSLLPLPSFRQHVLLQSVVTRGGGQRCAAAARSNSAIVAVACVSSRCFSASHSASNSSSLDVDCSTEKISASVFTCVYLFGSSCTVVTLFVPDHQIALLAALFGLSFVVKALTFPLSFFGVCRSALSGLSVSWVPFSHSRYLRDPCDQSCSTSPLVSNHFTSSDHLPSLLFFLRFSELVSPSTPFG